MSLARCWKRKLEAMQRKAPLPPLGTRFWRRAFEAIGYVHRLDAREPDWTATLAAYARLWSPDDPAVAGLHRHLAELTRRAVHGVPPCGIAEFHDLAAWFAANESAVPAEDRADLRRRIARGATAPESGELAGRLRRLRAGG